jgi:hypothetical protein
MDTNTIILTVGGGLIVGVVVLFIEYGYFQNRKKQHPATATAQPGTAITPTGILNQRWIDVIHTSAKSFCDNQGVRLQNIEKMKVENDKAYVVVRAWTGASFRHFNLVMDKAGDILEVETKY